MALESSFLDKLRRVLLESGVFDSEQELKSLFVDKLISRWRHHLPQAHNPASRVSTFIEYLEKEEDENGENALYLFIRALVQYLPQDTRCRLEAAQLAEYMEGVRGPASPATKVRSGVPFQAPATISSFVGREEEIVRLRQILTRVPGPNICCLVGMGGIGKTALATHMAHQLRSDFPDGVLWTNVATSEPLTILELWARLFGYVSDKLPDLENLAALVRGLLSDKKILIVLDNVQRAEDVRLLLPNGVHTSVLITTQFQTMGLDAPILNLSVLAPRESHALVFRILGRTPSPEEEKYADEINSLLAHLPLAIEIAIRRVYSQPGWGLLKLLERLRAAKSRLREIRIGERAVRASFIISWRFLSTELKQCFALLGLFEGRTFTVEAFASVAELEDAEAEDRLYELIGLSLLSIATDKGAGYFRQHPLLAEFALEHLSEQDGEVWLRWIRHYLHYATTHQHHYGMIREEWDNLGAALRRAYLQRLWEEVIDFAEVLTEAWFARGRYTEARQAYAWEEEAAQALGNQAALASCLYHWGQACLEQSDYKQAKQFLVRSFKTYLREGDKKGVALTKIALARVLINEGKNYPIAKRLLMASHCTSEERNNLLTRAETLYSQSILEYYAGNWAQAATLARDALAIQETAENETLCIPTLRHLASISIHEGDLELAKNQCQRAVELCERLQNQSEQAVTQSVLGEIYRRLGDTDSARSLLEKALVILRQIGDSESQAKALHRLSLTEMDLGQYQQACEIGYQSLELCRQLEDRQGVMRVSFHLGSLHYVYLGQLEQARERWLEALPVATILKHPLVETIRAHLDQTGQFSENS